MIKGIITDHNIPEGYLVFDTLPTIGIFYSSDSRNGTDVKTCVKELPDFEEVYNYFLECKTFSFIFHKKLDICLSLFYQPYFDEFYKKVKQSYLKISTFKKKYLIKHMLKYFSGIWMIEAEIIPQTAKDYYLEKDIYNKSKELLELLKNN